MEWRQIDCIKMADVNTNGCTLGTHTPPYLWMRSPKISKVSSRTYWFKPYTQHKIYSHLNSPPTDTHTLTGLPMAPTIFPVMLRLAEVATACVVRGNSEMTVLSPTLEMSLSLSEDENIFEQRELMMTSI